MREPSPQPNGREKEKRERKGERDEKDRELRLVGGKGSMFFCAAAQVVST